MSVPATIHILCKLFRGLCGNFLSKHVYCPSPKLHTTAVTEITVNTNGPLFHWAENYGIFRERCKECLTRHGRHFDKFTVVSHDSFVAYVTEKAIKTHIIETYPDLVEYIAAWEDRFDLPKLKRLVKQADITEPDLDYLWQYFYDGWDLEISLKNGKTLKADVKTALTQKTPLPGWNFLYPVIQANKKGKDLLVLVYYVTKTANDLRSLSKLVLAGAALPAEVQNCQVVKQGEKTRFGTLSQTDNFETEVGMHYAPLENFLT